MSDLSNAWECLHARGSDWAVSWLASIQPDQDAAARPGCQRSIEKDLILRGGGLELGFDPEMGSGNGKLFSYDEVLSSELASRADVGQSLIGSKSG